MTDNEFIDLTQLRSLYGGSCVGGEDKKHINLTITNNTLNSLKNIVPYGRGGGYGSTFAELSIKLMIALLSPDDKLGDMIGEISMIQSPFFINNVERLNEIVRRTRQ